MDLMGVRQLCFVFFLSTSLIAGVRGYSQANVVENQNLVLHVDAQFGNDSNSGSTLLPLRTIQSAVTRANTNNQNSIGTKIIVNSGIYREFVRVGSISKQTNVPMTIEAATTGAAIVAGSDVLANWSQRDTGNSSIYTHSWSRNFGPCAIPSGWPVNFAEIALHKEMVFVNNVPLTQVLSYGDMRAGTFFINEEYNVIHLWPPVSINMATAVVEAAVRPQTLSVMGRSNIVLRGLVFRHAATCINQSGISISHGTNIVIDSVQAVWNNWGGLGINSSSNITVQNSVASHNGGVGFQGKYDSYVLYDFNESDYNNWRGAQAALYDWGMGGLKLLMMRNTSIQNHVSYRNQAQGLWFDTDNKNITINNSTLSENVMAAVQLEANEGPISLADSTICSNGSGLNIINTEALTVSNSLFYNNGGTNKWQAEVFIAGKRGGRQIRDWQTAQTYDLYTSETVLTGNTFVNASVGQYLFGTYLTGDDWSQFANTLNASNNQWYDPNTRNSFKITNGNFVDLAGWQKATGTDFSSDWAPPARTLSAKCAVPLPSFTDFTVGVDSTAYTMTAGQAIVTVRVNSFGYGPVRLSVSGVPSGVGANLSPQSTVSGAMTLTLTASKGASNFNAPITIWAYDKNRVHSVTFYVQVVPTN